MFTSPVRVPPNQRHLLVPTSEKREKTGKKVKIPKTQNPYSYTAPSGMHDFKSVFFLCFSTKRVTMVIKMCVHERDIHLSTLFLKTMVCECCKATSFFFCSIEVIQRTLFHTFSHRENV